MKQAICSVCERKYWANVIPYGPEFQPMNCDPRRSTKPKTDKCKKHAPKTKTYPKTAKHHFNRDIKRRINRRAAAGLAPKKQKEKEDVNSEV